MNVEVLFPEELLLALREDPESFRKKVLIFTLGKLYEAGRISGGLGAKVLGCDRWEFYRLLSDNGFAVLDYPDEELEEEGEVGNEMAQADSGSMKAVINSTPLIALSMLNHLFVLQALFTDFRPRLFSVIRGGFFIRQN